MNWHRLGMYELDKRAERLLNERIDRGFARMDERLGEEWVNQIRVDQLDLADPMQCVVGQFAIHSAMAVMDCEYSTACEFLGVPSVRTQRAFGFEVSDADRHGYSYDHMTAVWADRIRARQEQLHLKAMAL